VYLYGASETPSRMSTVNTSISRNEAATILGGRGGGVYAIFGALDLASSTVEGNAAYKGGGVFMTLHSTMWAVHSTIRHNEAFDAGGIYLTGVSCSYCPPRPCTLNAAGSAIDHNTANGRGGALVAMASFVNLHADSSVSHNVAADLGGGMYMMGSTVTVDSSVSYNTASSGGGMYAIEVSTIFLRENASVSANMASYYGMGTFNIFEQGSRSCGNCGKFGPIVMTDSCYTHLLLHAPSVTDSCYTHHTPD